MKTKEAIHHGNQFKKIFKHGSWYFASSILTKITSFLLLPVFTRYLSPEEYGTLGSLEAISTLLLLIISLYLDSAFGRYYYLEHDISEDRVRRLYSTHFWFVCLWGGGVAIVGLLVSPFTLTNLVEVPFFPYMPLVFIPPLLNQLSTLGASIFRANLKAREISILNFVGYFAGIILTLVLLVPFQMGVLARLFGLIVPPLLNFVVFTVIALRNSLLVFSFDRLMLYRSLTFSLPLLPSVAGNWINGLSDRLILAYYQPLAEVGYYTLAVQMSTILYIFNDAMTRVQGPISMSALTENTHTGKLQISDFLSFYTWAILLFYLNITFFSKEVVYFFATPEYHLAYKAVGILAFIYVPSGLYRVFTNILSFYGKTWIISLAAILSSIGNVILNFAFIPYFGQYAAAWSTVASMVVYTAWIFYWAQRTDPVPINWQIVGLSFAMAFGTLGIGLSVQFVGWLTFWQLFAFKLFLIAVYFLPILVLPVFSEFRHKLTIRLIGKGFG